MATREQLLPMVGKNVKATLRKTGQVVVGKVSAVSEKTVGFEREGKVPVFCAIESVESCVRV